MRNLVEKASRVRDLRLFGGDGAEPTVADLTTLRAEDITSALDQLG